MPWSRPVVSSNRPTAITSLAAANPTDLRQANRDDVRLSPSKQPYWTPDQALAVVELLDGLRELILARYGLQLLDERRVKLQPFADSLFASRRSQKPSTSRMEWLTSGQRQAGDVGDDDLLF
jgi:hypothetical protein